MSAAPGLGIESAIRDPAECLPREALEALELERLRALVEPRSIERFAGKAKRVSDRRTL